MTRVHFRITSATAFLPVLASGKARGGDNMPKHRLRRATPPGDKTGGTRRDTPDFRGIPCRSSSEYGQVHLRRRSLSPRKSGRIAAGKLF